MKKKKKKLRRCSLCNLAGHTKRTCGLGKDEKKTKSKASGAVRVKVSSSHERSPHVVELDPHKGAHWKQVLAYKEKTARDVRPEEINLSQVVRDANEAEGVYEQHESLSFTQTLKDDLRYALKIAPKMAEEHMASFHVSFPRVRRVMAVITVIVLLILPLPAVSYFLEVHEDTQKVIEKSTQAFLSLQSSTAAAFGNNLGQARYDLNEALNAFSGAQSVIDNEHKLLTAVASMLPVVGTQIRERQDLLFAGHHVALGNTYIVKGLDEAVKDEDLDFSDRLAIMKSHMKAALPQYDIALERLSGVSPDALPYEYQEPYAEFRLLFATLVDDLHDLVDVMDALGSIIGEEEFRRYLLVFQNHHEIRPTGGFIGSMAVADVQKGKLMDISVPGGGSYDLQGQLDTYLAPPIPLQLVNYRWHFHDANWFADFKVSAEKLMWFYEHSRDSTVDGVIAINASVLERLLQVLGPVSAGDGHMVLAQEKALSDIQYAVEVDYDKQQNKPKQIIGDALSSIMDQLKDLKATDMLRLLTQLHDALVQKEIQVYVSDSSSQKTLSEFGWTGEVPEIEKNEDFLMVVNSNIGGGKSDARIKQQIDHQAVVQSDGSVLVTARVKRTHGGVEGEQFYGDRNINFMRFYVPSGARLVDAGGFSFPEEESFLAPPAWYVDDPDVKKTQENVQFHKETGTLIAQELGKTVFANWVLTEPGQSSEVFVQYILPFRVLSSDTKRSTYRLRVEKQSGVNSRLSHQVMYPRSFKPIWTGSEMMNVGTNGASIDTLLSEDEVFAIMVQRL